MTVTRYTKDKLYDLLPAIYRQRDLEEGGDKVLESLLNAIAKQIEYLEQDIENLYDNWFIETCDEWVVPYIADLFNVRLVNSVTKATFSQRSWVANTLSYRRRKGTVSVLEQLARDVTGWNARAVEFFQLLITTQYLNHLRISNLSTVNLRDIKKLDTLGTPFDKTNHILDVRNIASNRGHYNIPNIGIFLWRLEPFPVVLSPAFNHGGGKFTFNQLGYDAPLFNYPRSETNVTNLAEEINVASPIRRRALYNDEKVDYYYSNEKNGEKSIKLYVDGELEPRSIDKVDVCDLSNWSHRPLDKDKIAIDPVLGRIFVPLEIESKKIYVDYYYGFSAEVGGGSYPRPPVTIDGQEFKESDSDDKDSINKKVYRISKKGSISTVKDAITQWKNLDKKIDAIFEISDSEIYEEDLDEIKIPSGITLELKSSEKQRPLIRLLSPLKIIGEGRESRLVLDGLILYSATFIDTNSNTITSASNNSIIDIKNGDLYSLIINHCTLVPERKYTKTLKEGALDGDGNNNNIVNTIVEKENIDMIFLFTWETILTNEVDKNRLKSFLKSSFDLDWMDESLLFTKDEDKNKTLFVKSADDKHSISLVLDAENSKASITIDGENVPNYEFIVKEKVEEENGGGIGGVTSTKKLDVYINKISIQLNSGGNDDLQIFINRSIIGRIRVANSRAKIKVMDSIIDGPDTLNAIACYKALIENSTIFGKSNVTILELASNSIFTDIVFVSRTQLGCVRFCYIPKGSQTPRQYRCQPDFRFDSSESPKKAILDVCPVFTSTRYGDPGYAQLYKNVSKEIFEGADNESEMGAFNHLFQPQRINNMKTIINNEYLRFGLEAGIFLVT
jgi:hypothetical protein